jgi:hypothetical protein
MGNPFDTMRDAMVDVTTATMGYAATWTPQGGGDAQVANVHYKDSTQKQEWLEQSSFKLYDYCLEYRKGQFVGLLESCEQGTTEIITIVKNGNLLTFNVQAIEAKYDGGTLVAYLQKKKGT